MTGVDIGIGWDGGAIAAVDVRAELPPAARVLPGRTPAEALAMLGRLYSVCGHAQRAAAEYALAAAGGDRPAADRHLALEAAVARECVTEHLWRLAVDWPRKLGVPAEEARFARWFRGIGASGDGWAAVLDAELRAEWLEPAPPFEAFGDLAAYDAWRRAGASPAARLYDALASAAQAAGDAAAPARAPGADRGTGAFARHAEHPWIAALDVSGRSLEAHVAARAVAVLALLAALGGPAAADADPGLEFDADVGAVGTGRAAVATARGVLVHEVTLEAGRVASYSIRTPTERNFGGDAYRGRLVGRAAADAGAALRLADLWALALDPCVPYAVRPAAGRAGRA